MSSRTISLTFLPLFVVAAEVVLKLAMHAPVLPGLATTLAALGLGQVIPFVVFEALIGGKIVTSRTEYEINGAELIVRYPMTLQRDLAQIERLRSLLYLVLLASFLLWIGAIGLSASLDPQQEYSTIAILLGAANCIMAWLFLVWG